MADKEKVDFKAAATRFGVKLSLFNVIRIYDYKDS